MSNIVQVPASTANYTAGRLGYKITGIVIHTSVGTLSALDATFQNPARGASAHYGIPYQGYGDAPIHQFVSEANIAWHCGRFYPDLTHALANVNTIGIEHVDNGAYNSPRPDGLYAASSQLIREICVRYGIPIDRTHIRKHSEVSANPTACPDSLDIARLVSMAAGVYGPSPGQLITPEDDMLYVGQVHPLTASLKTFAVGSSYRERTASSPVVAALASGATVPVSGYCYSTSPVQSPDLDGHGTAGWDYLWWRSGNAWIADAILITTGLTNPPSYAIPTGEAMDTLFATQAQLAAAPASDLGPLTARVASMEVKEALLEAAPIKPHKHGIAVTATTTYTGTTTGTE